MNEMLPFLAVNYMFVCQRRDGEDAKMLGFGGLWHFSVLGRSITLPDMEARLVSFAGRFDSFLSVLSVFKIGPAVTFEKVL